MIWHLCLFHSVLPFCAARLSAHVHPMQGGGISCGGTSPGRGTPSGAIHNTQVATLQRWLLRAPLPWQDGRREGSTAMPAATAAPRRQCMASQQPRMGRQQSAVWLLCIQMPRLQIQLLNMTAAVTLVMLALRQTRMRQGSSAWHCGLSSCS